MPDTHRYGYLLALIYINDNIFLIIDKIQKFQTKIIIIASYLIYYFFMFRFYL